MTTIERQVFSQEEAEEILQHVYEKDRGATFRGFGFSRTVIGSVVKARIEHRKDAGTIKGYKEFVILESGAIQHESTLEGYLPEAYRSE